MILSDDEIIIQVIKGYEEALGLLFLYYEKHFRKLEIKIRNRCNYTGMDYEDIKMLMMMNIINVIKQYDREKSSFFAFWSLLEYRHIINDFRKKNNDINSVYNVISMDEIGLDYCSYIFNDDSIINDYSIKEEYEKQLELLKDKFSDVERQIIVLWSNGFTYDQISEMLNIKLNNVNYIITKCLSFLKKNK